MTGDIRGYFSLWDIQGDISHDQPQKVVDFSPSLDINLDC
jgi:hypothetical protein